MENDLDYKAKIEVILLDFAKLLSRKGMLRDSVTLKQIMEAGDELRNTPGFYHFVHDFLCDKCK